MKTVYTLILVLASVSSFSQNYKIYTAKKNGSWDVSSTWNNVKRTDGVAKDKYIIPASYTVTAPRNFDYSDLGDIQVEVDGTLLLASNAYFNLTQNSSIQINNNGSFETQGIGMVVIGNSWKLLSFGSRTIDGPVFTDFMTTGFAALTLSVKFLNFTAVADNGNVSLKWSTSEEINSSHFDVEMSLNGREWTKLGNVSAVQSSAAVNNYSFIHRNAVGSTISYRPRQVDRDGKFEYSDVAVVRSSRSSGEIYSANKKIYIELGSEARNVMVKVISMNGQVIVNQSFNQTSSKLTLDAHNMLKGTYVVHVSNQQMQTAKTVMIF